MPPVTARPRGILRMLAAAAAVTMVGACTDTQAPDPTATTPDRRDVVVDRGTGEVVDLRPVTVQAAPGDIVVLRSGNPGRGEDDQSPVHHLFTSAPADALPPLFTQAGAGFLPNPGVWGLCRGGAVAAATAGCPVPPAEGPSGYDGKSYFSLGALLPGEQRELPLDADIPPGAYRFTCAIHPQHHVEVRVVEEAPGQADEHEPFDAERAMHAASRKQHHGRAAVVLLGPHTGHPAAEVLAALPAVVRVPVGSRVVWTVDGRSPHTVELGLDGPPHLADTSPVDTVPVAPKGRRWDGTGQVRSGILSRDPSVGRTEFALIFTQPGRYLAYDRFHAGVTTTVLVR